MQDCLYYVWYAITMSSSRNIQENRMTNNTIREAMMALHGTDDTARAAAIETLGEHRHAPAVPVLLEILEQADPGTRFITVKALGQIADEAAVPALLAALRGQDMWTRAAAAGALINIGTASIDGLVDALQDKDKNVRRAAAKAIGKIGEASDNTSSQPVLHGLSVALLDVDKSVRRFAAEALGRLGAESKVPELAETLTDRNPDVRIAAFKALAKIDTPEAAKAVRNWVRE